MVWRASSVKNIGPAAIVVDLAYSEIEPIVRPPAAVVGVVPPFLWSSPPQLYMHTVSASCVENELRTAGRTELETGLVFVVDLFQHPLSK